MDKRTAISAMGKLNEKLFKNYISGLGISKCGDEARQIAYDIFGYDDHHYKTLSNLTIYSDEIKKDIIYRENLSMIRELEEKQSLKRTYPLGKSIQPNSNGLKDNLLEIKLRKTDNTPIKIFIIHGHDSLSLTNLKNVLLKIGADPKSFDDLPKEGSQTIIEILEKNIFNFDAVIALLTPDDEGRKRGDELWELRARQNVLIEAGYGLISQRDKSLIIALGGVSIPSDFSGIHLIIAPSWSKETGIDAAKRLKDMGFNVDPSKAI